MSTTEAAPARTGADKSVAATLVRRRPSDFACKQVMAVTGLVFGLFVLMHMVGNLKAYLGREAFDSYAVWLRHMLEPAAPYSSVLWVIRAVLRPPQRGCAWAWPGVPAVGPGRRCGRRC